jgi:hypothetical protein
MSHRRILPAACVLLAAAVAGMFFAPVFGLPELLVPVVVPVLVMFAVVVLVEHRPRWGAWRPLLLAGAGLLAVVETVLLPTTVAGLPTPETVRVLGVGIAESWELVLQSTWPARPDPDVLLFVPLLVVLSGTLGVELLDRIGLPLVALAPSFAVVVISQLYAALAPRAAVVAALAYSVAVGVLLAATRGGQPGADRAEAGRGAPLSRMLALAVPPVVLAVVGAVAAGVVVPSPVPAYSLKQDELAPITDTSVTSPLDELAYQLNHPRTPVFDVTGATGVDRWPIVVLDSFDGVNWSPGARYRRLGAELQPGPEVSVDVELRSARISPRELNGPWLPSQTWPAGVQGLSPLVEEQEGTLLVPGTRGAVGDYTLHWWEPEIDAAALDGAALAPDAPGASGGVGEVPPGIAAFAEEAVRGMNGNNFRTALVLEQFLRENYQVAEGEDLPTGHGWPQLREFLLDSKRGTSEQFAAAYVALARVRGIPARLVVGYRMPAQQEAPGTYTVRNGDVWAWPEVAVQDVGWVPLDPSGTSTVAGEPTSAGLAAAAAQAREKLPPPEDLRDIPVAPPAPAAQPAGDGDGFTVPLGWLLGGAAALLLAWLVGVPAGKAIRAGRRRRRPGAGAVAGAVEEARDRLRAHGVTVRPGMTVRDLAASAAGVADASALEGLRVLGTTVDWSLWSGSAVPEQARRQAWEAVRQVRRGLRRRGLRARLRAALEPASLLRPGP